MARGPLLIYYYLYTYSLLESGQRVGPSVCRNLPLGSNPFRYALNFLICSVFQNEVSDDTQSFPECADPPFLSISCSALSRYHVSLGATVSLGRRRRSQTGITRDKYSVVDFNWYAKYVT